MNSKVYMKLCTADELCEELQKQDCSCEYSTLNTLGDKVITVYPMNDNFGNFGWFTILINPHAILLQQADVRLCNLMLKKQENTEAAVTKIVKRIRKITRVTDVF